MDDVRAQLAVQQREDAPDQAETLGPARPRRSPEGQFRPKLSKSPFLNAADEGVPLVRREPQDRSGRVLLLRTPISPPRRSATSTESPLAKLSELLIEVSIFGARTGRLPTIGVPTMSLR